MQHPFEGHYPEIDKEAFVAPTAVVIGRVKMAPLSSLWFHAVARGDVAPISIGRGSNIQDGCVLHGDTGVPLEIGEYVTIGHNCIIHACSIADRVLVGMGTTILSRARIGEEVIIGAGSLVTSGTVIPPRTMALGSPARVVRELGPKDLEMIKSYYESYLKNTKIYLQIFPRER